MYFDRRCFTKGRDGPDGIVITMVTPTAEKNDEKGCLPIMAKMVAKMGSGRLNVTAATQNNGLRGIQKITDRNAQSKTNSLESIYLRDNDLCGCKGRCTNNVTLPLEKDIYQLEVFRKSASIGFGIRTNTAIPRDEPDMTTITPVFQQDNASPKDKEGPISKAPSRNSIDWHL
ncbi:unnamed protein product [Caenorhabditis nigoni]